MAQLIIGPLLRYVSETEATVWVETDEACEVEVLDAGAPTFEVFGHHYALVQISGLDPGSVQAYEVALDGERCWPPADSQFPPSVIRTLRADGHEEILFGSCRVGFPHHRPYVEPKDEHPDGREYDALYAKVHELARLEEHERPALMVLLGDQVYADDVSPDTREFIASRRNTSNPPGEEVADFEEYTRLYWDSWGDEAIRWLLSTVSSSMIWDDHDVNDDWNISDVWLAGMRETEWWQRRIDGAYVSYWVYQHAGNLSAAELADDDIWRLIQASDGDAGPALAEWAARAERAPEGTRFSFHRDIGRTRLVVLDSRAGRVLDPERRAMTDPDEWSWIEKRTEGDFDHLLLGTSLPFLLAPGMHYVEAWNEELCERRDGLRSRLSEKLRQALDLEHWAAFRRSFDQLAGLIAEVGSGARGKAPASIVVLSGDVHHAYLAEAAFRRDAGVRSAVYQAVCSPFRNPLNRRERTAMRFAHSFLGHLLGRALARAAGVPDPGLRWRFLEGPYFDNQVASLELRGRQARVRLEKTRRDDGDHDGPAELECVFDHRIA